MTTTPSTATKVGAEAHGLPSILDDGKRLYRADPEDIPVEITEGRVYDHPHIEIRDAVKGLDGKLKYLEGRAIPYNVRSDIGFFFEEWAPGALKKSIDESTRALPLLLFHDDSQFPIGVAARWTESDEGLDGIWKLDDGPEAQRAAGYVRDGLLNFMSIRFVPIRSDISYYQGADRIEGVDKDLIRRTEARLIETSIVSTPAFNGAAINDVRVRFTRSIEPGLHREAAGKEIAGWREYVERMRAEA